MANVKAKKWLPTLQIKKCSRQSFALNNAQFKLDGYFIQILKLGWVNMAKAGSARTPAVGPFHPL